jgi:nucleotide-binding universal stress UspA family protein
MHVLLATDGSATAIEAARCASQMLRDAEHITLLSVVTEIPGDDAGGFEGSVYSPQQQETIWNEELSEANDELDQTATALNAKTVDKRIEVGDIANTVCRIAEDLGVDLIVVGSHGRSGFGRLFLGSVSEHVVRHAPCPVLVVRERHQRKP